MAGVFEALLLGAVIGWIWERMPVRPLTRDIAASVIGWFAGGLTAGFSVFDSIAASGSGGLGAVSFGVSETLVAGTPVVLVLVLAAYLVRRRTSDGQGTFGRYSAVFLGALSAGAAAFWLLHHATVSMS